MMFDLDNYLHELILDCQSAFKERLLYMGLQGSWLRGEADENSDIDVMMILDCLSVEDLDTYRAILKKIGFYEKSCGFICGKEEMKHWNPLEVCQLRHTTKDLLGVLNDYLPPSTREDEINYIRLSLGNLYHELCHRYIHSKKEKNISAFLRTCKSAFFLIQNLYYLENGCFILSRKELKEAVSKEDRLILEFAELPDDFDFDQAFAALFAWCQRTFIRIEHSGRGTNHGS
ncbi:MAG: nucleotidyltransferase domain-containing protein [Solobacterium sp.]|nr:nucleotidyltransferase domain-containing protein [Solobacterium sp.]